MNLNKKLKGFGTSGIGLSLIDGKMWWNSWQTSTGRNCGNRRSGGWN